MKDLRQDFRYAEYIKSLGWEVVQIQGGNIFIKKLFLKFSIAKLQRPEEIIKHSKIRDIVKKYRIVYLQIEPKNESQYKYYKTEGFQENKNTSLPSRTIQFDLSKSAGQILKEMHRKARYNIRLSERRAINVEHSDDIESFSKFWHESSKSWGMRFSQKKEIESLYKAFGKSAKIINAKLGNKVVAAVLLVSSKDLTYYMYAASNEKGNKLHAPSLLVWESIKYAKKKKNKLFDFGGIYDKRFPLKSWKGFTEFKRRFGGELVDHPRPLKKLFFPFDFSL